MARGSLQRQGGKSLRTDDGNSIKVAAATAKLELIVNSKRHLYRVYQIKESPWLLLKLKDPKDAKEELN